tara:strand:+ start:15987 stop:16835 length:849 start_codon:yes stop_codon:yes gene_type:complete
MSKGAQTSEVTLPAFQEQMFKDLYGAGRTVAQQPFTPYTGPQVAGFNMDQLNQFDLARRSAGRSFASDPQASLQALVDSRTPSILDVGGEQGLQSYQNPFEQQVVDQTLADFDRQRQMISNEAQDRAIRAGAFGGSRSAILESEATRPLTDQTARTIANLRSRGFDQATRLAEGDLDRLNRQNIFRRGVIQDQIQDQVRTLGLLGGIGQQQQRLQQAALDKAREEFDRARLFPQEQLALLTSAASGVPTLAGQYSKKKTGLGDILGAVSSLGSSFLLGGGKG